MCIFTRDCIRNRVSVMRQYDWIIDAFHKEASSNQINRCSARSTDCQEQGWSIHISHQHVHCVRYILVNFTMLVELIRSSMSSQIPSASRKIHVPANVRVHFLGNYGNITNYCPKHSTTSYLLYLSVRILRKCCSAFIIALSCTICTQM